MSVEAMAWAFRQKVPPKPKVVLLALADQTDEVTGHVCYGKTDMSYLARKCSIGARSIHRYIGALKRNGYLIAQSGQRKGAANEYWLCLDRQPAKDLDEWRWRDDASGEIDEPVGETDDNPDTEDDLQDVAEGSAKLADLPEEENSESDDQNGRGGLPQAGRAEVIEDHNILQKTERIPKSSFSRKSQDTAIENRTIKKAAEQSGSRQFVIENSRAWIDWIAWRRRHGMVPSLPTCSAQVNGEWKRGWYMPTLFPPNDPATGPPDHNLSEEDIEALSNWK